MHSVIWHFLRHVFGSRRGPDHPELAMVFGSRRGPQHPELAIGVRVRARPTASWSWRGGGEGGGGGTLDWQLGKNDLNRPATDSSSCRKVPRLCTRKSTRLCTRMMVVMMPPWPAGWGPRPWTLNLIGSRNPKAFTYIYPSICRLQTKHWRREIPHFTLYTSQSFTIYTSHSTVCTLHLTLYTYTKHFTRHTPHFLHPILHATLYTLHATFHTPYFTVHPLQSTLRTSHSTLHTLHFKFHTLHFPLSTLNCNKCNALQDKMTFHSFNATRCAAIVIGTARRELENGHWQRASNKTPSPDHLPRKQEPFATHSETTLFLVYLSTATSNAQPFKVRKEENITYIYEHVKFATCSSQEATWNLKVRVFQDTAKWTPQREGNMQCQIANWIRKQRAACKPFAGNLW